RVMAKRLRRSPAPDPAVGETELARWFFAGRYADVVAASFDGGGEIAPADIGFVVGALTFVDRVDDAVVTFQVWKVRARVHADGRTRAACRFFIGLAASRAGYFDRSLALLVTDAFRDRHHPDPWVRAFVYQGLACQCYFTGRYPGAAANALRALR